MRNELNKMFRNNKKFTGKDYCEGTPLRGASLVRTSYLKFVKIAWGFAPNKFTITKLSSLHCTIIS